MGGPTNFLVPVAILYENQGLSLEEFKERLYDITSKIGINVTNLSVFNQLRSDYGVPYILNLPSTENSKELRGADYDMDFNQLKRYNNFEYRNSSPKITHCSFEILKENISLECKTYAEPIEDHLLREGSYLDEYQLPQNRIPDCEYQVTEVLDTKKITRKLSEEYSEEEATQKVNARAVKTNETIETFFRLEDALKKYPEYAPDNMYDFTLEKGILYPDETPKNEPILDKGRINTFFWYKENNKLYLDIDAMMKNLSANSFSRGTNERDIYLHKTPIWNHKEKNKSWFAYNDLILTCEAMRTKNYEFLGYLGPCMAFEELMYDNPETLKRYEKAVIDTETSMLAKRENWTIAELIRYRLESNFTDRINKTDYKERIKEFNIMKRDLLRKEKRSFKRRMRRLKRQKKKKSEDDNDLPF